jgi:hypothetical protein
LRCDWRKETGEDTWPYTVFCFCICFDCILFFRSYFLCGQCYCFRSYIPSLLFPLPLLLLLLILPLHLCLYSSEYASSPSALSLVSSSCCCCCFSCRPYGEKLRFSNGAPPTWSCDASCRALLFPTRVPSWRLARPYYQGIFRLSRGGSSGGSRESERERE